MANPWKEKVLAFNRRRAQTEERARDLTALLEALPPGQKKRLLEDPVCGAIIRKYTQEVNGYGEKDGEDHQLAQRDEQPVSQ